MMIYKFTKYSFSNQQKFPSKIIFLAASIITPNDHSLEAQSSLGYSYELLYDSSIYLSIYLSIYQKKTLINRRINIQK